jgi:hypothetical protein
MEAAVAEDVVAEIDGASEVHVACVMDSDGLVTGRFSFTHDTAAIRAMAARLRSAGVAGVAIERGDGPVVANTTDLSRVGSREAVTWCFAGLGNGFGWFCL